MDDTENGSEMTRKDVRRRLSQHAAVDWLASGRTAAAPPVPVPAALLGHDGGCM